MPKLLSDVKPDAKYFPVGGTPMEADEKHPELVTFIAVVANNWTLLEMELAETLAHFLHTQPAIGLAIHNAITSVRLKQATVAEAATARQPPLTDEQTKVLHILLSALLQTYDKRIVIEHGMWAYSPDLTDALLRINPKHVLKHQVLAEPRYFVHVEREDGALLSVRNSAPFVPATLVEVYEKQDFMDVINQIGELANLFATFRHWTSSPSPAREQLRLRLCDLPRIREILSPSPKAPRSKPSKPRQSPP